MGVQIPHGNGQFWWIRATIVKYKQFRPGDVQKRLNRSICRLRCGLEWAKGCTSSTALARWRQSARRHSSATCAEMVEPTDLPFGLWSQVGRRKHNFNRIRQVAPMCPRWRKHIAVTWRIRLNHPSMAAMSLMSNYFDHFLYLDTPT